MVDATSDAFQKIYHVLGSVESTKIDALYSNYLKTRLENGLTRGGLSRDTYRKIYLYDTTAELIGADLVWSNNFNSSGGGEYILRNVEAVESFKKSP